jgi:hypothetical protein
MVPKTYRPDAEHVLGMVGSNKYGRYPKITDEQTFNMIVAGASQKDNWLTSYPGYKKVLSVRQGTVLGRALYTSDRGNFMIAVIDNGIYKIQGLANSLSSQLLFTIDTYDTDVFIDENFSYQIAICDQKSLWIYDWRINEVNKAVLPINTQTGVEITAGYVTFHDGYFIVPDSTSQFWYLSKPGDGLTWNWSAGTPAGPVAGSIQTKPGNAVAVLRAPGKGNLIYVFGSNVTEMWYDNGNQLFPYQRSNSVSIDYGCLSPPTIAAMDEYVVWLGINEKSGPALMVTTGSSAKKLTNSEEDGIDFKLQQLVNPQDSFAFFFRESGHIFYQITFLDPKDNLTLTYDFNTNRFYTMTNEHMNFHIAQRMAFFNNTNYFTSLVDGDIYECNSQITYYDYTTPSNLPIDFADRDIKEIPRVRVCPPIRTKDSSPFIGTGITFPIEQGNDPYFKSSRLRFLTTEGGVVIRKEAPQGFIGNFLSTEQVLNPYVPRIDMSLSRDGAENFGSSVNQPLQPQGVRQNKMNFYQLGRANDLTPQFRFWSKSRVVVGEGIVQIRHQDVGPDVGGQ